MDIQASRVLVTGGCGGIGLGIGEYFARLGKQVTLVDRNTAPAAELVRRYPTVRCIELDIADHGAVDQRIGALVAGGEAPQVLVNGAGWSPKYDPQGQPWKPWTMPMSHWKDVMAVNIDAAFNLCRLVLPAMIQANYGRIVNIASVAAHTGGGGVAPVHYVTGKAALLGMTKAIAGSTGQYNITVNAINPGRIDTPMIRDVPDEVNQGYAARIPLKRLGTPGDVAHAVGYLCSDHGDYLTGTQIEVNGGLYMGS